MATFYIDLVNGNDANAGTSWGTAWRTVNSGATAARIAPGDIIKIAKSPNKVSLGNGTWTSISSYSQPANSLSITAATNASPISITTSSNHGFATGDIVQIQSAGGNTAANGTWIITVTGLNTFTLDNSTGNGTYTSGGLVQNANYRAVKLASNTQTALISDVYLGWTAANGSTLIADTTYVKSGPEARQLTSPASSVANTLYAYQTLPSATDFSAFTHITLWFRSGGFTNANTWRVCLCSDTLGATIVDSFPIPASGTQNQLNALVLARTGGGNLGSSIQSVAIYTGSSPVNSSIISFDNINACTDTGLNLHSVLSPISDNQDIFENYPIGAIINNVLLLDNGNISGLFGQNNLLRGYSGTGGTFTTYYRNAINYATISGTLSNITPAVFDIQEAGTKDAVTVYSGGWNTATDTQDGVTLTYIPSVSVGWTPKDFTKIEYCGILRGGRAFSFNSSQNRIYPGVTFENCFALGTPSGMIFNGAAFAPIAYPVVIKNFSVNNSQAGLILTNFYFKLENIKLQNTGTLIASQALSSPFTFNSGNDSYIKDLYISNSSQAGVLTGARDTDYINLTVRYCSAILYTDAGGCNIYNLDSSNNAATFINWSNGNGGNIYIQKLNYTEPTLFSSSSNLATFSTIFIKNINGNTSDWRGLSYGVNITRNTSITKSGNSSWRVLIENTNRDANWPQKLKLAEVYCTANVTNTISVWMYFTNSSMGASLEVPGQQIEGVNNNVVSNGNSAVTGSWQQVSVSFTPTENGIVKVYGNVWSTGASNESVYFDDMSFPSGVSTANLDYSLMGEPWAQNQEPIPAGASVVYAAVGL